MNQESNQNSSNQGHQFGEVETTGFGESQEFATFTPRAREPYWRRIGGGSLGLSIFVHAIFVMVALFIIKFSMQSKKEEPPSFQSSGGGGGKSNQAKTASKRKAVTMNAPKSRIAANVSTSAIILPDVQMMSTDVGVSGFTMPSGGMGGGENGLKGKGKNGLMGDSVGPGTGPGHGPGFVSLPLSIRSRCSPQERAEKMRQNGGNEECEKAVIKALDWLKRKQNANGSWGSGYKSGMTGLALLAFYGHCETPDSPFYGQNVSLGIGYLTDLGMKNKGFFSELIGTNHHCVYEHGIACYAMGETYSFSKLGTKTLPNLRETFEDGVKIIVNAQQESGSWGYGEGSNTYVKNREDMSVAGWQFQALKAAKHTNLKIDGLQSAIKKAADYLESKLQPSGGFGQHARRGEPYGVYTMTGIGVLGLQTLSGGNVGKANKGIRFLEEELDKDPLDWKKNANLYCWYYNTQAFFQKGGKEWEGWNKQCREQILKHQNPDGSYAGETPSFPTASSSAAGADADIYRTCLCTLMLEVYYRYLKVGNGAD